MIQIETREHLLSTLTEASELEHTLMCLYLYAILSLKQSTNEDLTQEELQAVQRWRKVMLEVAVQEMSHLALVANLTTAIGGSPQFHRPSFPVQAGLFPSDFVIELAPFDLDSLDHFIFLERPLEQDVAPSHGFKPDSDYKRLSPQGRLMTHTGDYETVGQLYGAIENGIRHLSVQLGDENLFCGSKTLQITPKEVSLEGLDLIQDQTSALRAIQTIVEQGEGARTQEGSHFEKFKQIRREYQALRQKNSKFKPARPSARNPAMRKPVGESEKIWISHPRSVRYLDLGNAIYGLMLKFLLQVYSMESRPAEARASLLDGAFTLMHTIGQVASILSRLPASDSEPGLTAGLTFSLDRHLSPLELTSEKRVLLERLEEIQSELRLLLAEESSSEGLTPQGPSLVTELSKIVHQIEKVQKGLGSSPLGR